MYVCTGSEGTVWKLQWTVYTLYSSLLHTTGVYGFWKLWAGFIIPYNEFGNVWVWTFWINPLTYVVYGCTMWMYGELAEPIYFGGTYVWVVWSRL